MFFRRKRKSGGMHEDAPTVVRTAPQPVNFGLFGIYVRSLPTMGR